MARRKTTTKQHFPRPRFKRLWPKGDFMAQADKLHRRSRPEFVAERVAACFLADDAESLTGKIQALSIEDLKETVKLLTDGEEAFQFRIKLLHEARRRVILCAAEADRRDTAAKAGAR